MPQPVWRTPMTSPWSPKMESPWQATERAVTWKTVGVNSPASLYILGIIRNRPCEAVKVVHKAPVVRDPCRDPATPPSDCIWVTAGTEPQIFFWPAVVLASDSAAIGVEGVIG